MTRKDYELIAQAIHTAFNKPWLKPGDPVVSAHIESARVSVVGDVSRALKADNHRFDPARFTAACAEKA
jgi:hypothetical protein